MTPKCSHGHAKASTNYCLCAFHLSSALSVFFANSIVLGMRLNLLIRTLCIIHLLCLESITHRSFQFEREGFKHLLPSMVQALPFFLTNSSRIWPTMKFSPTSSPLLLSSAPCLFMDKGHQTITTNLWLNPKFYIQTISKTTWKSKVQCIVMIHLVLLFPL